MPILRDIFQGVVKALTHKKDPSFQELYPSTFLTDEKITVLFTDYPVWFATNRKPVLGTPVGFTNERNEQTTHGICQIAIRNSRQDGQRNSNWWNRRKKESEEEPESIQIAVEEEQSFWERLKGSIKSKPKGKRRILLYIHGYRVMFEEAAQTAAQLGYDLSQQ